MVLLNNLQISLHNLKEYNEIAKIVRFIIFHRPPLCTFVFVNISGCMLLLRGTEMAHLVRRLGDGLNDRGVVVRFLTEERYFYLLHSVHTGSGATHLVSDKPAVFPWGKAVGA
jgi:hypothetical protein